MNARVQYVIDKVQNNFQTFVLGWGLLSFVIIPIITILVGIKVNLTTLAISTSLIYWTMIILHYSWKAKKELNT